MYESMNNEEDVYIVRQKWAPCAIILSVIQVAVMAAMLFSCEIAPLNENPMVGPPADTLKEWGAKDSDLIVKDGEWWRLVSPIFLHAGVLHLLCNLGVQLEAGASFEKEWGSARWMIVYFASGILGSVGSAIFMPGVISVGCSGALMGLFGGKAAEVVLRAHEQVKTRQDSIAMEMRKAQCGGVTWTVVIVLLSSFLPFVDWAAHAFGFVGGLVVGIILFSWDINSYAFTRIIWLLVGIAATVAVFGTAIACMYNK